MAALCDNFFVRGRVIKPYFGLDVKQGDMVAGYPCFFLDRVFILGEIEEFSCQSMKTSYFVEIDPESISKCTAKRDINGTLIYENMKIKGETEFNFGCVEIIGDVYYDATEATFMIHGVIRSNGNFHERRYPLSHLWNIEIIKGEKGHD